MTEDPRRTFNIVTNLLKSNGADCNAWYKNSPHFEEIHFRTPHSTHRIQHSVLPVRSNRMHDRIEICCTDSRKTETELPKKKHEECSVPVCGVGVLLMFLMFECWC